ncbi:MAG: glycosyltransferase family 2 protein [Burkholderiaceae bacterium]
MTLPQDEPLVSVVVPFYNTAKYLRECLESVLAQSYGNFELILQDNASTDGSTAIALEFAGKDPRIRYFRLASLVPQVPNYNLALERISPDSAYCKIVQADDWIYPECLRSMVAAARRSPRVGLVSSYRLKETMLLGEGIAYTQATVPGREVARSHLLTWGLFLFGSPTTVMYRSDLVRQRRPFYAEHRLHEDTEACYEILRESDFAFVHQVLSFSRADADSIYGRTGTFDAGILDRLIAFRRYGPEFLSPAEHDARMGEIERRYYRQMAWSALSYREAAYWRYQREGLQTQGLRMEPLKFARGMLRVLAEVFTCPRQALGLAREWRRRLRPANGGG